MSSNTFGQFDENTIGSGLVLSQGDQVVQTASTVDAHRLARSTFGMDAFAGNVEAIFWSPNADSPSLVSVSGIPPLCVGAALDTDSVNDFVGHGDGYGYCPGDGKVYHNNALIVTLPATTSGQRIGILIDPVALTLIFLADGLPLGTPITIASGKTWYYAATVSGAPGDLAWLVNSGVSPIRFPQQPAGWWVPKATINTLRLATIPYISGTADSIPNTKFSGVIDNLQNPPSFARGVKPWPMGDSTPSQLSSGQAQIEITIDDPSNKYGQLMTQDVRDTVVLFSRLKRNASYDSATLAFVGIIDKVEQDTDQTKKITLTDKRALMQVPLTRALFGPNVDPSVAGKPMPLSLGTCRNYEPTLYDAANQLYACHDGPLSALGIQRLAGKPLALNTDYQLLPDGTGIKALIPITGKFTVESTSTGAAYNPAVADGLAGAGNFLTATPDAHNQPTGWTCYPADGTHWQLDANGLNTPSAYGRTQTIYLPTYTLKAGKTYIIQFTVTRIPDYGIGFGYGDTYILPAQYSVGMAYGPFNVSGFRESLQDVKTYSATVHNGTASDSPLGFTFVSGNITAASFEKLTLTNLRVQPLPDVSENVPLDGMTLREILQAVMIDRGPFTAADIALSDADAIDAATGYKYGLHLGPDDQPTIDVVVAQILDSICGAIYQGSDGLLHIFRLTAPELADPVTGIVGSLTETDIDGYLIPSPDNAEGFTTRLEGCENYSPYSASDFGTTSITVVPSAERSLLEQSYQWTVVSGVQLSQRYNSAYDRSPHTTLFDVQMHGQTEASRVGSYYASPRNFYAGTVFTPIGRNLEIGQIWNVTYPIGNLMAGKQLVILYVDDYSSQEKTDVVFAGL